MNVLITGSSGRIGSELAGLFDSRAEVLCPDNNTLADCSGAVGDTAWNLRRPPATTRHFRHYHLDIRDRAGVQELFRARGPFELIVHCAAQPSHDLAARRPFDDFDVNATGTLNVLEATRLLSPEAVFVLMSTNKVYGDAPNELPLRELPLRWDYARSQDHEGVTEEM